MPVCCCRLFLSAEPPPTLERALPISILQASVKLTNEPPEGLKANLLRAYGNFSEEIMESCAKQSEFRQGENTISFNVCPLSTHLLLVYGPPLPQLLSSASFYHITQGQPCVDACLCPVLMCRSIIFALSFFHAALLERKKFGVGNLPGARSGIGWNMSYPL